MEKGKDKEPRTREECRERMQYVPCFPKSEVLKIIRKHWSGMAAVTDICGEDTPYRMVSENELLTGELEAAVFQIGCYTIRSARRVCRETDGGGMIPVGKEEIKVNERNGCTATYPGLDLPKGMHIMQEISARRDDSPEAEFTCICRAAESLAWTERIAAICTAKENWMTPDKAASLLVLKSWCGSSFGCDTWYKLAPEGKITELPLHDMDSDRGKVRFS